MVGEVSGSGGESTVVSGDSVPRIVLASASPRRRELLRLIGVEHEVIPASVDESVQPGEAPRPHAMRLARAKAEAVARSHPDALIIGADTIVVVEGEILGKPADQAAAAAMLKRLGGRTHTVFTAVAVARNGRTESDVETVDVTFRDLTDAEIGDYIATGEPLDKAGAYGIQGFGATIVERIEGDYFAVMGLALLRLMRLMARVGVDYRFGRLSARPPSA